MAYYRLYFLNGTRFVRFEEIEAEDDEDAVRQVSEKVGGNAMELWCGKRKVMTFPAATI